MDANRYMSCLANGARRVDTFLIDMCSRCAREQDVNNVGMQSESILHKFLQLCDSRRGNVTVGSPLAPCGLFNFRVLRVQAAAWPRLKGFSASVFAEILSRKKGKRKKPWVTRRA